MALGDVSVDDRQKEPGGSQKKPLVSVVIPVYNVERFLKDCVESLLEQTLQEIELIFVDDKSTDGCLSILRRYESDYPEKVRVIASPENLRQGGARNLGIRAARADYVGFCDSDDYAAPTQFETLYKRMLETGADIVFIQAARVEENITRGEAYARQWEPYAVWPPRLLRWENQKLTQEGRSDVLVTPIGGVVTGLFRRKLITQNQIFFPEGVRYEDNFWGSMILAHVNKVALIPSIQYYYRQQTGSTIHIRNDAFQYQDRIQIERSLVKEAKQRGVFEPYYSAWEYIYITR